MSIWSSGRWDIKLYLNSVAVSTHLSDWYPAPGLGCKDNQSHLSPFPFSSHLLIRSPGGHLVQSYHFPCGMTSQGWPSCCMPLSSQSAGKNCPWGNSRSSNCKQIDVTLNLSFPIVLHADVSIFIYYLSIEESCSPRSEQISPYCSITPLAENDKILRNLNFPSDKWILMWGFGLAVQRQIDASLNRSG